MIEASDELSKRLQRLTVRALRFSSIFTLNKTKLFIRVRTGKMEWFQQYIEGNEMLESFARNACKWYREYLRIHNYS